VVLLTCLGVREHANRVYNALLGALGLSRCATPRNVDDGPLALSVVLALLVPPIYLYGVLYQDDASFIRLQSPLLLFFFLVCSDSCHYESHLWQARSCSSSRSHDTSLQWYHRLFGLRFMQYALSPFYPLPQHIPHLLVHHRVNMASAADVDWVGDVPRDSLTGFVTFLVRFDWRTYLHGFGEIRARAQRGGLLRRLFWHYCFDLAFTLATYAFCAYQSPVKGVFAYALHSLLNWRLAWITFFVEHPFHHPLTGGSFAHPWHATTLFDAHGEAADSHAAHHHLAMRTVADNAEWANAPAFAIDQLKHRNLALCLPTRFDEWVRLPFYAITRQHAKLHSMLYFVPHSKLQAHLTTQQLEDYAAFQAEVTPDELRRRMQPRTDPPTWQ